jgi:hypothetical protein
VRTGTGRGRGIDVGHALFSRAAIAGIVVTILTEALSLFGGLTRVWLVLGWTLVLGAGVRLLRRHPPAPGPDASAPSMPRSARAVVAGVLAITAAVALLAPPNNWDSMTYHMPRVAHWSQAGSIAPYPTHILRQLWLGPWAEFAILHLYVVAGGDRLANLVQWLAFAGCIAGSALVAGALGGGPRARGLAAVACATVPMAISQATSTQNDLVASFWLLSLGYWVLRFRAAPSLAGAALVGVTAGLGVLTKLPVAFLQIPWLVAFGAVAERLDRRQAWRYVLAAGLVAVALNAGHLIRTVPLVRAEAATASSRGAESPDRLAPDWTMYVNTTLDPRAVASNALRNATLHLTAPSTRLNGWLERAVLGVHRAIGFDPNDARTTLGEPFPRYHVGPFLMHEDFVGNPLHFVAALLAGAVVWRRRVSGVPARLWAALAATSALMFVAALKWQPWNSRLHLPLFVLACPLIGIAFGARRRLTAACAIAVCLAAVPSLLATWPRTLVGEGSVLTMPRDTQRFRNHPHLQAVYEAAADLVRDVRCREVGMVFGWDGPEYPLWPLVRARAGRDVRLEHALVENGSAGLAPPRAKAPCALIIVGRDLENPVAWRGRVFVERWHRQPVRVYGPAP